MKDTMTHNIEEPKPSNKKLLFISTGIAITVIGCAVGIAAFSMNSNSPESDSANQTQSSNENTVGQTPVIKNVTASTDENGLSFSIEVAEVDTEKWTIEYQVADQDRKVKDEGTSRSSTFTSSVKLSNSAYYRIKVRAISDTGGNTAWSENYTVELDELEGFKTLDPLPAYFDTGWAKGTDSSLEGAKKAIETAWGISEVTDQQEMSYCLPVNTGEMNPELLLPPIPSVVPQDTELKYMTNEWNGSTISITYLWC